MHAAMVADTGTWQIYSFRNLLSLKVAEHVANGNKNFKRGVTTKEQRQVWKW